MCDRSMPYREMQVTMSCSDSPSYPCVVASMAGAWISASVYNGMERSEGASNPVILP